MLVIPRVVVALVILIGTSSCGGTVAVGPDDPSQTMTRNGWQAVDPIPIKLPLKVFLGAPSRNVSPDLDGPLIVNVWATDCAPCRKELPILERAVQQRLATVIGFTRDVSAKQASRTLEHYQVSYPNWSDPAARVAVNLDGRIPLNAVPCSVLIRDGFAVAVHIGPFLEVSAVVPDLESFQKSSG